MADRNVDLLVIGGGAMGLWAARRGVEAGLSTLLVEAGAIGTAGGSAQPLGALMPHAPQRWGDLAAFQFEALVSLEEEAARLQAETGIDVGYGRIGRVAPVRSEAAVADLGPAIDAAAMRWIAPDGRRFSKRVRPWRSADPLYAASAPAGVRADDLSARIAPRAYLSALAASLKGRAEILAGVRFLRWDGAALLSSGARIGCGALVVAAGAESFAILGALGGPAAAGGAETLGAGVKGQAVIFEPPAARREEIARAPLIYDGGLYIVPHADGRVAVGATTETFWDDPARPDARALDLAAQAQALSPLLEGERPARCWAGLRPRSSSRMPAIGRWEAAARAPAWVMTGGYKITFGIAHRAASALIDRIAKRSERAALPDIFHPAEALRRKPRPKAPSALDTLPQG